MAKKTNLDVEAYPYPTCREQHHWLPYDGDIDTKVKVAHRVQKCGNCPTMKYSVISMRPANYGQLLTSRYRYPTDYRIVGGLDVAGRGQLRMVNFLAELKRKAT